MRFSIIVALATAALASARTCGTEKYTRELIQANSVFASQDPTFAKALVARATVVDLYFHVLSSGTSVSQGNIPDSNLQTQLNVMNQDFASAGISFVHRGTTRTVNSSWFRNQGETAMKQQLHQGDYGSLNVYFMDLGTTTLGYCYYPVSNPSQASIIIDGCSIMHTSVANGPLTNYNLGKTLTHEAGHWFGLAHTFEGGCSGLGDSVADTPAEASAAMGCPVGRNTCSSAGVDPIHNYMDYSYDSCMTEFTPLQITRMNQFYNSYRL